MTMRHAVTTLALLILPSIVSAQGLAAGKWTGSVNKAGDPDVPVTFVIPASGATDSLIMTAEGHGDFALEAVKLSGDTLTFRFHPGPPVDCVLTRQADGTYGGNCTSEDGDAAAIILRPPGKEQG